jgi:hypothetical protein
MSAPTRSLTAPPGWPGAPLYSEAAALHSIADVTRLLSEIRQINASRCRLCAVDETEPAVATEEPEEVEAEDWQLIESGNGEFRR